MVSASLAKTFGAWVVLFTFLAFFFRDTFERIGPWIVTLLFFTMFGVGLTFPLDDSQEVVKRPLDFTFGVSANF